MNGWQRALVHCPTPQEHHDTEQPDSKAAQARPARPQGAAPVSRA